MEGNAFLELIEAQPAVTIDLSRSNDQTHAVAWLMAFKRGAQKVGWDDESIGKVLTTAKSGDYDHLIDTLTVACGGRVET